MNVERTNMSTELSDFLETCKQSSEKANGALQSLIDQLERSEEQSKGIELLNELKQYAKGLTTDDMRNEFHFHFFDLLCLLNQKIR